MRTGVAGWLNGVVIIVVQPKLGLRRSTQFFRIEARDGRLWWLGRSGRQWYELRRDGETEPVYRASLSGRRRGREPIRWRHDATDDEVVLGAAIADLTAWMPLPFNIDGVPTLAFLDA